MQCFLHRSCRSPQCPSSTSTWSGTWAWRCTTSSAPSTPSEAGSSGSWGEFPKLSRLYKMAPSVGQLMCEQMLWRISIKLLIPTVLLVRNCSTYYSQLQQDSIPHNQLKRKTRPAALLSSLGSNPSLHSSHMDAHGPQLLPSHQARPQWERQTPRVHRRPSCPPPGSPTCIVGSPIPTQPTTELSPSHVASLYHHCTLPSPSASTTQLPGASPGGSQ